MKMPIEWHEQCLENSEKSLREKEAYLDHFIDQETLAIERLRKECELVRQQIAEAKRQGKDGFDAEKFMKKRGK